MNTDSDKGIYLDHAATTAVDPRVVEAMLPFWTQRYGNPSSIYSLGRDAAKAVNESRAKIAELLNADPKEIIFTSGGSESDNLAIRGAAFARRAAGKGQHIVTLPIEHHAVSHTIEQLVKRFGFTSSEARVDENGLTSVEDVAAATRDDTALITVMMANNEVGTIEPIAEIGAYARSKGIAFHTDAVQAGGALPIDVKALNVDFLSLSAHKFYGPKGIGVLYARRGAAFWPMQTGGAQEANRRAGTENTAYIVGMARALELAYAEMEETNKRLIALRDRLIGGVLGRIPEVELTGHPVKRLANSASFIIRYVEGESMLLNLDAQGIWASTGSACTSASLSPSHVLTAMGYAPEVAHGSLRMSLGKENTAAQMDHVAETLAGIVAKLRAMSPLYKPAGDCAA